MDNWIKCSDRLPDSSDGEYVLGLWSAISGYVHIICANDFIPKTDIEPHGFTHWQPLPAPPKEPCCDLCEAEGPNACRGSKGDDDEPAEEEEGL